MSNYVNKIKKDGVEYDIQDKRLEVTIADAGKVVGVNEEGALTLFPTPSGGTKLYKHTLHSDTGISFGSGGLNITFKDFVFITDSSTNLSTLPSSFISCENIEATNTDETITAYIKPIIVGSKVYACGYSSNGQWSGWEMTSNPLPIDFTDTVTEL